MIPFAFFRHTSVVDAVVRMVLESRGVTTLPSGLTHNDLFYREVRFVAMTLKVKQKSFKEEEPWQTRKDNLVTMHNVVKI